MKDKVSPNSSMVVSVTVRKARHTNPKTLNASVNPNNSSIHSSSKNEGSSSNKPSARTHNTSTSTDKQSTSKHSTSKDKESVTLVNSSIIRASKAKIKKIPNIKLQLVLNKKEKRPGVFPPLLNEKESLFNSSQMGFGMVNIVTLIR